MEGGLRFEKRKRSGNWVGWVEKARTGAILGFGEGHVLFLAETGSVG